jgi:hypothetical protein
MLNIGVIQPKYHLNREGCPAAPFSVVYALLMMPLDIASYAADVAAGYVSDGFCSDVHGAYDAGADGQRRSSGEGDDGGDGDDSG